MVFASAIPESALCVPSESSTCHLLKSLEHLLHYTKAVLYCNNCTTFIIYVLQPHICMHAQTHTHTHTKHNTT